MRVLRGKPRQVARGLWRFAGREPEMRSCVGIPDQAFLARFDFPHIQDLLARGEVEAAKGELIDHFGRRIETRWPVPGCSVHNMTVSIEELADLPLETLAEDALVRAANAALDLDISDGGVPPRTAADGKIDWHHNPTGNPEWFWWLHRHHWWPILGLAYYRTGDERYAAAFVAQLLDWIQGNPPPPRKNEASHNWRLMEVALRLRVAWIPCFALFYASPHFHADAKLAMLRAIYDHAAFLERFTSKQNHLLREANGLLYAGVYFPELDRAGAWQRTALSRLAGELSAQVNPDGSHVEMSTGYQWLAIDEYEKTYRLLNLTGISWPAKDLARRLELMYGVLAGLVRPDGTFPQLNDGFILWPARRLEEAGRLLGRKDYVFIGTGGRKGSPPLQASTMIRDAGLFVMRSGWSAQANYLLMDAGPYGGFHGHEDKLGIEVFALGRPFIVDPGSYTYDAADPFRTYFMGSQGHNTVLVDGLSQVRRFEPGSLAPKTGTGPYGTWISTEAFDYAAARYTGRYGPFEPDRKPLPFWIDDVVHTRTVWFVKPDYWLLLDELSSAAVHTYQQLFHAHPGVRVETRPEKTAVLQAPPASLLLVPASPGELRVDCITGSEAPIQGWYSDAPFQKEPATTVVYETQQVRSPVFATLMYPLSAGGDGRAVSIRPVPVSGNQGYAFEIQHESGTDHILLSAHEGVKAFGAFQSAAMAACIRTDRGGRLLDRFDIPSTAMARAFRGEPHGIQ